MKILHIIPSISLLTGGPPKAVTALCKSIVKLGHTVELWTTDYLAEKGPLQEVAEQHSGGYKTVVFRHQPAILAPGMPSSKLLVKTLERSCADFDLVHVHSLWNPVATFSLRIVRKLQVPYCITPHGTLDPVVLSRNRWKKIPWAWLWERSNVEGAELLHWTTQAELEKALTCGWRFAKSVVVPLIIDWPEWADLPSSEKFEDLYPQVRNREVILFVGRINWVKNIDLLISALCMVRQRKPSAMLVCAGPDNDDYQTELARLAERLGLKDVVLFTGMLKGVALKSAFARAQVFALVSKKENFGIAAAEALVCGLPVVLSEGVDLGREWPAYDFIAKVKENPADIAAGIIAMLDRASRIGKPDYGAITVAMQQWGLSSTEELVKAYGRALSLE